MRYLDKINVCLLLIGAALLFLSSCTATPAEAVAAISAGVGAAAAFVRELTPLLSPEMQAKLSATASSIDGTVEATKMAIGVIADAVTQFKTAVGSQAAETSAALQKTSETIAALPGREEVYLAGGGFGALGTAASRAMSIMKHGAVGKMAKSAD